MFGGRGYYIVFALCLLAAGIIGYITLFDRGTEVKPETPAVDVQPNTPTTPVVKPAPVVLPEPKIETAAEAEVEITEPSVLLPQVVSPLSGETVTVFSMTELLYDATMADWRTHDGIDIAAELGTPVAACAKGTVSAVTTDDLMGTTVTIDHGKGMESVYANLSPSLNVQAGTEVDAGTVLGTVGTSAIAESASPSHLHFALREYGVTIDPGHYLH